MEEEQIISKLNHMQHSIGQTLMMNTIMFNPQMLYYQLGIVQQELYNSPNFDLFLNRFTKKA